jgi:hypothetical protein
MIVNNWSPSSQSKPHRHVTRTHLDSQKRPYNLAKLIFNYKEYETCDSLHAIVVLLDVHPDVFGFLNTFIYKRFKKN